MDSIRVNKNHVNFCPALFKTNYLTALFLCTLFNDLMIFFEILRAKGKDDIVNDSRIILVVNVDGISNFSHFRRQYG